MACGSKRDCWDRKESNPRIGAAEAVVMMRRMWRSTAAAVVVVVIIFG